MTRLEVLRLICNGPTHPAMMHDRRERAQNGVSLLDEAHVRNFHTLFPMYLYYLIVECTGISGRPGHVLWREVSSHLHLIEDLRSLYQKDALSHPHPNQCQTGPGWEWLNPFAPFFVRKSATGLRLYRATGLDHNIRSCKLRAIKSPTSIKS